MKLIDKDALVAEIERYKHKADERLKIKGRTLAEDCKDSALQNLCGNLLHFIDTLEVKEVDEEPVSKDLEEAADKHLVEKGYLLTTKNGEHLAEVEAKGLFKAGAKWQKEQMEKNRIEHCDNITEEQYNLETGFLDDFLDKKTKGCLHS